MADKYFNILSKGLQSELDNSAIKNGKLRFTVDSRRVFIDHDNRRIEFTDVIKDFTEAEIRAILAPLDKLYLAKDSSKVMYWDEEWIVLCDPNNTTVFGSFDTFPRPGNPNTLYIDNTTDPNQMYAWNDEKNNYIIVGANGLIYGSIDVPVTLKAANWVANPASTTAPFKQEVEIPQVRKGMTPLYFMSNEENTTMQDDFSKLAGYDSEFMKLIFYAVEQPAGDIDIILKGLPPQSLELVDPTVMIIVEPDGFVLNESHGRYEKTIEAPGMTEGYGGTWDIVRQGEVLTIEESRIACNITDVKRLDNAVKIICLEPPEQRYVMCISGTYPNTEKGGILLGNMEKWLTKVENMNKYSYDEIEVGEWLGQPLYRKMIDFGELPVASAKSVVHNITDADQVIIDASKSIWYKTDTTSTVYNFIYQPFISHMLADRTEVAIVTNDIPAGYGAILCLEYTKCTDVTVSSNGEGYDQPIEEEEGVGGIEVDSGLT